MSGLLFAYVCMLTAFKTLSLLQNLVNKESESETLTNAQKQTLTPTMTCSMTQMLTNAH